MQISRNTFLRSLGLTAAGLASSEIPGLARAGQVSGVPARATRITAAEVLPFTVPLKGPQRTALGTTTGSHGVYVRLRTAEGVTGLGESAAQHLADEAIHGPADAIEGIRQDAIDMINIKLMKSGGILQAVRIATIAEAANLKCMVGCTSETRVSLTAAAHVVLSQKSIRFADLDAFVGAAVDPVIGGMRVEKGVVVVFTTRTRGGRVELNDDAKALGVLSGEDLDGLKARMLLIAALGVTRNPVLLQSYFQLLSGIGS